MTLPAANKASGHAALWADRLRAFLPTFLRSQAALEPWSGKMSTLLYGSTQLGVDDEGADLDVYGVVPSDAAQAIDAAGTRFFSFELDGKEGHVTTYSREEMQEAVDRCRMDTIFQLRHASVISDPTGQAGDLLRRARLPLAPTVRDAFVFHHYVEMRSEHRACDNPMERGDSAAILLSLAKAIAHALRAAIVLDGEPYPYDKWLEPMARRAPSACGLPNASSGSSGCSERTHYWPQAQKRPIRSVSNCAPSVPS